MLSLNPDFIEQVRGVRPVWPGQGAPGQPHHRRNWQEHCPKPKRILPFKEIETKATDSRQKRDPKLSLSGSACVSSNGNAVEGWDHTEFI